MAAAPRVIVVQMGARHDYAVARQLHARGALAALYTDLCWTEGAATARRRVVRDIPAGLVHSSPAATALGRLARVAGEGFAYTVEDAVLGWHGRRLGLRDANLIYTVFGGAERLLRHARRRGLKVASEVIITPAAQDIEAAERRHFPGWDAAPVSAAELRRTHAKVARMIALSDLLLCPSPSVVEGFASFQDFDPRKARVVPYGVPVREFADAAPKPGRVLFAGHAGLRKGIPYLAAAATELRTTCPSIEVVVAGGVSGGLRDRPELAALTLLGHLDRDRMAAEFRCADVMVLPTLAEGSATVVYEAMAAGVPVVTTRSAGSVMRDGHEGYIVPERDSAALAAAVRRIVLDRALRDRMAAAARTTARDHSEHRWGDALYGALAELIQA